MTFRKPYHQMAGDMGVSAPCKPKHDESGYFVLALHSDRLRFSVGLGADRALVYYSGIVLWSLIGCDAIDWFRGRLSLFDPAGIIGLVGVHFFFLAPLLHVTWDSWMLYINPPPGWRDWLGGMAILNAAGLVLYRCAKKRAAIWEKQTRKETVWQLN
jgi:hypothetical protein